MAQGVTSAPVGGGDSGLLMRGNARPMDATDEAWERSLATRIRSGDVTAFAALLNRYWQPLVAYAEQKLGSSDVAEDVVQEAHVRLWEKRRTLDHTRSPRPFLYRMVHNLAVDELRKRQVRRDGIAAARHAAPRSPTPAQVAEAEDLAEAASRAVAALPDRRRDVFILGHLHNLSYRQIADALGITPRTVANHMSLALADLRASLRPFLEQERGGD